MNRVLYDVANSGEWFTQALLPLVGPFFGLIVPVFVDARRIRAGGPVLSRQVRIAILVAGILVGALFAVPVWSTLGREGVALATGHVSSISGVVRSYHRYGHGKSSYTTFDVGDQGFRVDCCDVGIHYTGPSFGNDVLYNGMSVKLTYLDDRSITRIEQLVAGAEKSR